MPSASSSILSYLRVVVAAWREETRDDAELMTRFAEAQDEAAFATLVWRHGPLVWRTCCHILGDTPDGEDAFQATFLALARKAGRFPVESLAGWLHRTARRAALDAQAGVRRRQRLEQQLRTVTQPPTEESADRTELYAALDEELGSLPDKLRLTLLLHYLEGKSQVEVAHLLGCSRGVVQRRLARGEAILRERLKRRGLAEGVVSVGALLGSTVTASALPARLIGRTARVAVAFRSGTLTGGAAEAARTVLGALPSSLETTIMRKSLWLVLACCLGLAGAGLVTYQALSARLNEPGEAGAIATQTPRQPGATARVDCFGDPLPAGALARMGTVRQWYGRIVVDFIPFLAFSPDDKTLVSQSKDGSVCLWDAAKGKEMRRIITDSNPGTCAMTPLALSPDGRTLVTGRKGTVYFWEMATGKFLRKQKYQGPKRDNVQSLKVVFLPDGQMLCLEEFLKFVEKETQWGVRGAYVWDGATGKEISQLSGPRKGLFIQSQTVAFSPDGKMMAAVSDGANGGEIILWEVATGKKIRQLQLSGEKKIPVYSVAFSPDGKTLAAGGGPICVWEVATGKLIHRFEVPGSGFSCLLAYSPDGKKLVGGSEGHLWDVATGKEIRLFGWDARIAVFSPSGRILAGGDEVGVIRLWEVATGKGILPHKGHHDLVTSIAYSPDGKTLASVSFDKTVRLWEAATGKEIRQLAKHADSGSGTIAYSPDGKMLVSMGNVIHLWDTVTGKEIRQFQGKERPESVTFSPDGKLLAATLGTDTVCLWQVATGKQIYTMSTERSGSGWVWSVVFSPDGRMLAAPGKNATISLWGVTTGKPIGQLKLKQDDQRVRFLAFSPDSRMLATSSVCDDRIHLWEVASGEEIRQLDALKPGFRDGCALAFSSDGRMLATAAQVQSDLVSTDPTVRLWEVASGKEIGQLSGHRSTIRCVAFSPDGKTLASASNDLTCLVWDLTPYGGRLKPDPAQALAKEQLEAAWADLAKDPAQAYAAVRALQAVPAQAIPLLRERVRPIAPAAPVADPKQLQRWIADLDANSFAVRDTARREIEKLGELALPAVQQALKGRPSLEAKRRLQDLLSELEPKVVGGSPRCLRELRSVQVLESIGTAEARQVLQTLAKGVAGARLTQEAQAALARLVKRSAARP